MDSPVLNKKFKYSVIIPFHNQGEHLMDAVECCKRQSIGFDENIEIILIDDASTDIGSYIGEIYAEMYPENIRYRKIDVCTITEAKAVGREMVSGKYYLFLNADDLLDENSLQIINEARADFEWETEAFVMASHYHESDKAYSLHAIQDHEEKTVFESKVFEEGLKLLGSENERLQLCVAVPTGCDEVLQYVFVPEAILRTRHDRKDLSYDYQKYTVTEPYTPPYTKEQVKETLFPRPHFSVSENIDPDHFKFMFSIIMPVYNVEDYIEESIESVIAQDINFVKKIQLILVDDGSTDNSGAICDRYKEKYPDNIIVIHQENAGSSAARYNGAQYAEGQYINFLDPDDYLAPDVMSKVRHYFRYNPTVDLATIPLYYVGAQSGSHPNNIRFTSNYKTVNLMFNPESVQTNLPTTYFRRKLLPYFSYDLGMSVSEDAKQTAVLQLLSPVLGLVKFGGYFYRRFGKEHESQSTDVREKPAFYLPAIKRFFLAIFSLAREKYGFIPRFIQYLVYFDLRYRFDRPDLRSKTLTPEEEAEFQALANIVLSQIEDSIMFSQSIKMQYKLRNLFRVYKNNGAFDVLIPFSKKAVTIVPIDIWAKEIPEEYALPVFNFILDNYDRTQIINELQKKLRGYDLSVPIDQVNSPDMDDLFQFHSVDSAVRIWRNRIPSRYALGVFDWMCARYGEDEVILALYRLISRLKDPSKLAFAERPKVLQKTDSPNSMTEPEITPKTVEIKNNKNLSGKIKSFRKNVQEEGFGKTAIEYANNIFHYKLGLLPNLIPADKAVKPALPAGSALPVLVPGVEPIIMFESVPAMGDNTFPVYEYLLGQGLNEKYKFIWAVDEPEKFEYIQVPNVSFVQQDTDEFRELKFKARAMVSCNRFIFGNPYTDQISLFLTHGSPLKASPTYSYMRRYNYVLCQSEWLKPYVAYENDTPFDRLRVLGIPRNDALYHPDNALLKMSMDQFSKVIVWLPTYRQHRTAIGMSNLIQSEMHMGIPVIQTPEEAAELNELLREKNILLVLKPHPSQDLSNLIDVELSNFRIVYNAELEEKDVQLYELLGASDALITDYSSVYYDYLLTGKPIGLTTDDFDAYNKGRGFVYRDPYDILKGQHIQTITHLADFVSDVASGKDSYEEERQRINDMVNTWQDDQSTQRVSDFLINLL